MLHKMSFIVVLACSLLSTMASSFAYNIPATNPYPSVQHPPSWKYPPHYYNVKSEASGSMDAEYVGNGHSHGGVKTATTSQSSTHPQGGELHSQSGSYQEKYGPYVDGSQYSSSGIYYQDSTTVPNVLASQSNYGTAQGDTSGAIIARGVTKVKPNQAQGNNTIYGYSKSARYGQLGMYGQSSTTH